LLLQPLSSHSPCLFSSYASRRGLHSFPTRRSSDLREWYALDGVFLDGMANDADPAHVAWYAALRDSIRAREPAWLVVGSPGANRSEEHTSELQSLTNLVCRLLLEKKKHNELYHSTH